MLERPILIVLVTYRLLPSENSALRARDCGVGEAGEVAGARAERFVFRQAAHLIGEAFSRPNDRDAGSVQASATTNDVLRLGNRNMWGRPFLVSNGGRC